MKKNNHQLTELSKETRKIILKMVLDAQSGHIGPSFSIVEILCFIYFNLISLKNKKDKDYLILSKGHAAPALYAIMVLKKIIKKSEIKRFRKIGGKLQGHPDKLLFDEIDSSTGSLGQGLSVATGYALGQQIKNSKRKVFCIIGDGELQEGQIWEALLFISFNKILNLVILIDSNKFQNENSVKKTLHLGNLKSKFKSFGFDVYDIDGHDFKEISIVFKISKEAKRPVVIILNTIKGKGVSFMENDNAWHSKKINESEYRSAIKELR